MTGPTTGPMSGTDTTTRVDLLTLTPDALAALANRGLVKRAAKGLDAGATPEVEVAADGTVRGRFPDGVETALPAHAGLETASCTCPAAGVCRHRIGLVLAYQRQFGPAAHRSDEAATPAEEPAPDEPVTRWSPGSVADEALTRLFGAPALAAARHALESGFPARLHRPTPGDPVARAELRACTVRFLVPGEPGYAHTDAAEAARGEMVVLAVWAFRAADERGLDADDVELDVRPDVAGSADTADSPAAPAPPGLADAVAVVDELLLDGAGHAGPVLVASLRRAAETLDRRGLRWPAAALVDLVAQLDAYRERGTRHRPERLAELVTEVYARHRAALHGGGASPLSRVLGSDEPAETPLRRVRLTSLGCRIDGAEDERTADVFLAHPDSGTVLVLRKRWTVPEGEEAPTGALLAHRRVSGIPLRTLATADLVSESASRSASRVVRLASSRVARTGVTPLGPRAWASLPASVAAPDYAALEAELGALPPRLVRPRVEAELVRVVPVAEVEAIGYDPGDQRLDAVIADAAGATAIVSADHHGASPAALDSLAAALEGEHGAPLFVSGTVHRSRGGIAVRPIAVLTDEGFVVPDLAPGEGDTALAAGPDVPSDPLDAAVRAALTAGTDAAHHGLRHASPALRTRLADAAATLHTVGLRTAAASVTALSAALAGDDPDLMVTAWVDAHLRLTTTAELH